MKRTIAFFLVLVSMAGLSACAKGSPGTSGTIAADADHIQHVSISGNARSIIIRQSDQDEFAFYNKDLNADHTYHVHCDEKDDILNIDIQMEQKKDDNDILGSFILDIPKKEFRKIEVTGDFDQISLYTLNSDVLIHADQTFVNLDIEADRLEHDITLDGSETDALRGVSVYFDEFPENVSIESDLIQSGAVNVPQDVLK